MSHVRTRGGKREGAGRPPKEGVRRKRRTLALRIDLLARLKQQAAEQGCSLADVINASLHNALRPPAVNPESLLAQATALFESAASPLLYGKLPCQVDEMDSFRQDGLAKPVDRNSSVPTPPRSPVFKGAQPGRQRDPLQAIWRPGGSQETPSPALPLLKELPKQSPDLSPEPLALVETSSPEPLPVPEPITVLEPPVPFPSWKELNAEARIWKRLSVDRRSSKVQYWYKRERRDPVLQDAFEELASRTHRHLPILIMDCLTPLSLHIEALALARLSPDQQRLAAGRILIEKERDLKKVMKGFEEEFRQAVHALYPQEKIPRLSVYRFPSEKA